MKSIIINDGLPEPIFMALQNDKYDPGMADYTPSSLNQPAYQISLGNRLPPEKITEPASSRIWALLGSAVHYMIELAGEQAKGRYTCEKRYYGTVDTLYGPKKIGAQIDLLDTFGNMRSYDMKVTSVYSAMKDPKADWVQQMNVGRWCIWKETGYIVNGLTIVGIWRDWVKTKVNTSNYPASQCGMIEIPLWDLDETERWIIQRVEEREYAKAAYRVEDVPPCTDEDVWAKPTKYAVMKPGGSRAVKLCDTETEALAVVGEKSGTFIEMRPGARTRCEGYCPVSSYCPAFADWKEKYAKTS